MKLTIEAEHACEIIDFLKNLPLEKDKPTNDDWNIGVSISQSILDEIAKESGEKQPDKPFLPFNKNDMPDIEYEFIDVIWNDGQIGYNQSVNSLNLDNVVAYRVP